MKTTIIPFSNKKAKMYRKYKKDLQEVDAQKYLGIKIDKNLNNNN